MTCEAYRCCKYNEFHYSVSKYQNETCCPVCSEEHGAKQCRSKIEKCSNYVKYNLLTNTDVPFNHMIWDKKYVLNKFNLILIFLSFNLYIVLTLLEL